MAGAGHSGHFLPVLSVPLAGFAQPLLNSPSPWIATPLSTPGQLEHSDCALSGSTLLYYPNQAIGNMVGVTGQQTNRASNAREAQDMEEAWLSGERMMLQLGAVIPPEHLVLLMPNLE